MGNEKKTNLESKIPCEIIKSRQSSGNHTLKRATAFKGYLRNNENKRFKL